MLYLNDEDVALLRLKSHLLLLSQLPIFTWPPPLCKCHCISRPVPPEIQDSKC